MPEKNCGPTFMPMAYMNNKRKIVETRPGAEYFMSKAIKAVRDSAIPTINVPAVAPRFTPLTVTLPSGYPRARDRKRKTNRFEPR